MEAYFGFEPDEEEVRALIAAASDGRPRARRRSASRRSATGSRARSPASSRCGPGAFSSRRHDRSRVGVNDVGVEIEAGSPSAPAITARRAAAFCISTGSSSAAGRSAVLDVGCGAGVLAIAAAKVLRRKAWLGDIDPVAVQVANANARLNGVGSLCRAVQSRGVEARALREGAPYDVVFANILAKPLRLIAPSLAAATAPDGEAIVSGLLLADVAGVLASWRAQGFYLAERIDLEGWASLRLRR